MCGIAGGVATEERPALDDEVAGVAAALRHRGPDAGGLKGFRGCTLGHTRLRIIDLSPLGDQPMADEDGSVWVVFNGEIYNFAELRAGLEAAGHRFRSTTDTEVLVHLYEERGEALAADLRGMFAFALWDDRRRRLVLCRDRLGIKPLYYRDDGGRLSFGSEVKALVRPGDGIDEVALAGYLRTGWVPGPGTIVAGVQELAPAHVLVWEGGRTRTERYWSPPVAGGGPATSQAELGAALRDAVRRHVVADVPIGLFLSSGVDSVSLARLAADAAPDLRTYTVAFDSAGDESAAAAALARRLGLANTVVRVGQDEAAAAVDAFTVSMDQPTVDGLNSWLISRAVRQAGVVVALSGLGGDELFSGYSTFWHVPRLVAAGRAFGPLGAVPAAAASAMGAWSRTSSSRARRALEAIGQGGWGEAYGAVRGLFSRAELARLWPSGPHRSGAVVVDGDGHRGAAGTGALELANYLPFQLLRDTDVMSMAHALEVRVPLLDDAVVDLATRGLGSGEPWGKSRLVGAVDPALADLLDRPKRTFTLPIDDWMRGRLQGFAEDALQALGAADLGFDRRVLTDLWHGYLARRVGWRPLWALTVLGRWLGEHATRTGGLAIAPR